MSEVSVGANETGVWQEHRPDERTDVPWEEITSVSAVKYDCKTRVETILEFEHVSGHCLEVNASSHGFDSFVSEVGRHYSLEMGWYSAIEDLSPDDDAVLIWSAEN